MSRLKTTTNQHDGHFAVIPVLQASQLFSLALELFGRFEDKLADKLADTVPAQGSLLLLYYDMLW